jgi:tight adherence protein B
VGVVTIVIAALALAFGAPVPAVALAGVIVWRPWVALAAVPVWVAFNRRRSRRAGPDPDDEAVLLRSFAGELTGGASLRAALVAAAGRVPRIDLSLASRMAALGRPAEKVSAALGAALPVNGRLAAAAWLLAARSGGPVAEVAQTLALRAADEGALRRERAALTAQARASAWVVTGLPAALILAMALTGRLTDGSDPALLPILAVGLSLQAAGVGVVWRMLAKAGA